MKKMKITIGEIRNLVRNILLEGAAGTSITADPTDVKGFYPYDLERGVDIHGFWYKSPGRDPGTDGDPGRPKDADDYVGFKTKGATPADAVAESKPPESVTK